MISTITAVTLALSRSTEFGLLAKATILLALGLAAVRLARHARASFRHLALGATFAGLLALPLSLLFVPRLAIPVSMADAEVSAVPRPVKAPVEGTPEQVLSRTSLAVGWPLPTVRMLFGLGCGTGALILLAGLARDLGRLRSLRRNGLPWIARREFTQRLAADCGVRRPVEILLHEEIPAPLTCGWRHPAILLPSDAQQWNEADLRRALVHEMEHVRRGDWAAQLAARAICAVYWFHPLVWIAWRRLCLEAERACDDAVIAGAERTDYAEQLVSLAQRLSRLRAQPALGMANRSDLSARVSAILDGRRRRGPSGALAAALAFGFAGAAVFAIAPFQAVAQHASERRATRMDRALVEAAQDGDVADVTQLLNVGANVNSKISGDGSPLIVAAREGHLAVVRLLLERGADVNMPVSGDGNPLIMAAREGHAEIVTLLLDRGASIDQVVESDENALIQASGNGQLPVVKLLVSRGANVNARVWVKRGRGELDGEWRTPLNMARKGRHDAVAAYLISTGARE